MDLVWSRDSDKYRAYVRAKTHQYQKTYQDITQKYHLNISEKICKNQALKYARHAADEKFQVFTDAFKGGNLFAFIGAVFEALVGITIAVLTLGVATPMAITGVSLATVGGVSNIIGQTIMSALKENALNAQNFYSGTIQALNTARDYMRQAGTSTQITHLPTPLILMRVNKTY
ncbi:hypothetical protein [Helicobacter felis]|uniref:hypothetical protein n=1 Tax=Helicobacter felis TaxID=214 RepID=UPI000CEF591C|nr:hypothetical protein [Helicobacter felis]